jgi:hypothetical protein
MPHLAAVERISLRNRKPGHYAQRDEDGSHLTLLLSCYNDPPHDLHLRLARNLFAHEVDARRQREREQSWFRHTASRLT